MLSTVSVSALLLLRILLWIAFTQPRTACSRRYAVTSPRTSEAPRFFAAMKAATEKRSSIVLTTSNRKKLSRSLAMTASSTYDVRNSNW